MEPTTQTTPAPFVATLPLTKVTPQDDGSCMVEGFATVEELDRQGEVVLYDASKAAFAELADTFSKRTGGQSLGNLRSMHLPIAAGKVTAWWADDAVKGVGIRAHVVDPVEAKKCVESVYTMFSIGAPKGAVKRTVQPWGGKPTPVITEYHLGEISLVDNGAAPSASFTIAKIDLPDLDKSAEGAMAQADTVLEALKGLAVEFLAIPGDPSTYTFQNIIEAMRGALAAKYEAKYQAEAAGKAAAADPTPTAPTPTPTTEEPMEKIDTEALAKSIQDSLAKTLGPLVAEAIAPAVAKAVEGLAKTSDVEAAVAKATEGLAKADDLQKLQARVDQIPAPVGRPVLKTLSGGGSDQDGAEKKAVEDAIAEALEKAATLGLTPEQDRQLRIELATGLAKARF